MKAIAAGQRSVQLQAGSTVDLTDGNGFFASGSWLPAAVADANWSGRYILNSSWRLGTIDACVGQGQRTASIGSEAGGARGGDSFSRTDIRTDAAEEVIGAPAVDRRGVGPVMA
jgi:hypothetical protein